MLSWKCYRVWRQYIAIIATFSSCNLFSQTPIWLGTPCLGQFWGFGGVWPVKDAELESNPHPQVNSRVPCWSRSIHGLCCLRGGARKGKALRSQRDNSRNVQKTVHSGAWWRLVSLLAGICFQYRFMLAINLIHRLPYKSRAWYNILHSRRFSASGAAVEATKIQQSLIIVIIITTTISVKANLKVRSEVFMGLFSLTWFNTTHQLIDPTQLSPSKSKKDEWIRLSNQSTLLVHPTRIFPL